MPPILGIDYGTRRVGLALSDEEGILAMPFGTVDAGGPGGAVARLKQVCVEKKVDLIVMGLPLNMDGTEGPSAGNARELAKALREAVGIPVEMWDERLSTMQVEKALIAADARRSRRRDMRDQLAAQVILQGYLDHRNRSQ